MFEVWKFCFTSIYLCTIILGGSTIVKFESNLEYFFRFRNWETESQRGKAISFYIDIYPYIGETIVSAWACIHIERPKFVRYDSTVYQSLWVRNRAFIVASKQFASTFVQRVYKCTLNRNKKIVQGEHNSCTIKWIGAYFLDGYKCFIMLGIFVIISSFVLLSLVWLCVGYWGYGPAISELFGLCFVWNHRLTNMMRDESCQKSSVPLYTPCRLVCTHSVQLEHITLVSLYIIHFISTINIWIKKKTAWLHATNKTMWICVLNTIQQQIK